MFGNASATHLEHLGVSCGRDFVDSVFAAIDQGRRSTLLEKSDGERNSCRVRHSQRVRFGSCGVTQGAKHIENCRNCQILSDGAGVTESGVKNHRVDVRHGYFGKNARDAVGFEGNVDSQSR